MTEARSSRPIESSIMRAVKPSGRVCHGNRIGRELKFFFRLPGHSAQGRGDSVAKISSTDCRKIATMTAGSPKGAAAPVSALMRTVMGSVQIDGTSRSGGAINRMDLADRPAGTPRSQARRAKQRRAIDTIPQTRRRRASGRPHACSRLQSSGAPRETTRRTHI